MFANFKIKRFIIHEIYKREENKIREPFFNQELANISSEGLDQLQARIIDAIGNDSHSLEMDIMRKEPGSVFSHVTPFLQNNCSDEEFIKMSKQVVNNLVIAQSSRNIPGGLILIFEGTIGQHSQKCICIIKAEKHNGFTFNIKSDKAAIIDFINDLFLTPEQKLYKISIIINNTMETDNTNDIKVFIFDSNNDKSRSNAAAIYFYDTFMGCSFTQNSDVLTRDFYNFTKDFISNKSGFDGEQKMESMTALYVYLKVNTSPNINVNEFGDQIFGGRSDLIDKYSNFMQHNKIPLNSIRKNTDLIISKLKRRKIKFSNQITIEAPVDNFNDNFKVVNISERSTTVEIRGNIINGD